jgi:7,8-dihydropterin-6-yl-methyl-4-(beta-D-ribofuranosyl)aminobenzene 5'-phosphate synthase
MTESELVISIVCDNWIHASGFLGQHGFSALIESGGHKYLFDAGPAPSFQHNWEKLGHDLKDLDKIFLSHGHYDHTESLAWVVGRTGPIEIVAHPDVFHPHLKYDPQAPEAAPKDIGCPHRPEDLAAQGARFTFVQKTSPVAPGVVFVTGVSRRPGQTPVDSRLVVRAGDGQLALDPLEDDASLLLESRRGPVLLLGCAHAGLANILDHLAETLGVTRLHALLGGTHLQFTGLADLPRYIARIEDFSPEVVGVSHCTGFTAAAELSRHFGPRFTLAATGGVFRF